MTSRLDELNKKFQNENQGLASRRQMHNSNSLRPPPTSSGVTFPSINSAQRASSASLSAPSSSSRARQKVVLQPGHSPLDWAELNRKTPKYILRGVEPSTPPPQYVKVNKEELKKHKTQKDCWTCINNKVFNITPYINFHPGGVDEIMKCAGKDGTSLFNKYHSWVNVDRMLENCIVGVYVG
ncbi:uncharacterized protein KGF55_004619 [Candida pseudojiufengensis]|uniref:uncharacterized protein n=1 Tax=Candida pseudojiufengensis TaxID=497109 RepID=UPI0022257B6C|nr:uncharacterized protein KGF55_004619 [Candida pseudojiufengensis]KAI5960327.1 hypothetical protein KGF55_004619 [Candida pseudojiufengensis]